MIAWLTGRLGRVIAPVLAVIAFGLAIWFSGRKDAITDREIADLRDNVEARERIDATISNNDSTSALERLSKHGQLRD